MADPSAPQSSFDSLVDAERFVLWAIRAWLAGEPHWQFATRAFVRCCGLAEVESALTAFEGMLELLDREARRELGLRRPGCAKVSAEETALLALVSAAQADDAAHLQALGVWLVPSAHVAALTLRARAVATALRRGGQRLPRRREPPPT